MLKKLANFNGLREYMQQSSTFFSASNPDDRPVEENWSMFKQAITTDINNFISQHKSGCKHKVPWISDEMCKKDLLHKKAICTKKQH